MISPSVNIFHFSHSRKLRRTFINISRGRGAEGGVKQRAE